MLRQVSYYPPFQRCQAIGKYDPAFAGGTFAESAVIPSSIFEQLSERRRAWPVSYSAEEMEATWLASYRLLLFVQIAEPAEGMDVRLAIDGQPITLRRAYTSVVPQAAENTFVGWYADVSAVTPDIPHHFEASLPPLAPGQFQGLFFENVETRQTMEIAAP